MEEALSPWQLFFISVSHTHTGKTRPLSFSPLFKVWSSLMWRCSCDAYLNASRRLAAFIIELHALAASSLKQSTESLLLFLLIYLVKINLWGHRVHLTNCSLIFSAWLCVLPWLWVWWTMTIICTPKEELVNLLPVRRSISSYLVLFHVIPACIFRYK